MDNMSTGEIKAEALVKLQEIIDAIRDVGLSGDSPSYIRGVGELALTLETVIGLPDGLLEWLAGMVQAAGRGLADRYDTLGVLADWLEENDDPAAGRYRKLTLQDGDVFVFYPQTAEQAGLTDAMMKDLKKHAEQTGRQIICVQGRATLRVQHVTAGDLRKAGWRHQTDTIITDAVEITAPPGQERPVCLGCGGLRSVWQHDQVWRWALCQVCEGSGVRQEREGGNEEITDPTTYGLPSGNHIDLRVDLRADFERLQQQSLRHSMPLEQNTPDRNAFNTLLENVPGAIQINWPDADQPPVPGFNMPIMPPGSMLTTEEDGRLVAHFPDLASHDEFMARLQAWQAERNWDLAALAARESNTETADERSYRFRQRYACKVCGNVPNEDGMLEHGRGCYTQSEDGGGSEFIEMDDEEK